ncbi:hypothetical protein BASA62_003937 [Batrachochytrium salamandrivorans]|nr:hypothetical protein BASA62_003937 [Batrachochytrium salamandrivorans]
MQSGEGQKRLHDPPEPVPKVIEAETVPGDIENEHPKPSKSILKKSSPFFRHRRKVDFNGDVQLGIFDPSVVGGPFEVKKVPIHDPEDANNEQSDNQGPPQTEESTNGSTGEQIENPTPSQSKVSTQISTGATPPQTKSSGSNWFKKMFKGRGTTGGTYQQFENPTSPQTDVSTEDSTGERTQNPTPSQSKVSTQISTSATPPQSKSSGFQWFKNLFGGKGSKGGSYQQFENQDPPQSEEISTQHTTGATSPQTKSSGSNWFKKMFKGRGSTGGTYRQFENQDPPQRKESTEDTTGATPPQTKSSGSNWFKKMFKGKGSTGGTYRQFENRDPFDIPDPFGTQEIPITSSAYTNDEQSGNPTPPQSKVSTKDTTSKQHKNPTPPQSKISTQRSTGGPYVRFGNQDPSQQGGSRPLSRFERVMY